MITKGVDFRVQGKDGEVTLTVSSKPWEFIVTMEPTVAEELSDCLSKAAKFERGRTNDPEA